MSRNWVIQLNNPQETLYVDAFEADKIKRKADDKSNFYLGERYFSWTRVVEISKSGRDADVNTSSRVPGIVGVAEQVFLESGVSQLVKDFHRRLLSWNKEHDDKKQTRNQWIFGNAVFQFARENGLSTSAIAQNFNDVMTSIREMPDEWHDEYNFPQLIVDKRTDEPVVREILRADAHRRWADLDAAASA